MAFILGVLVGAAVTAALLNISKILAMFGKTLPGSPPGGGG